MKLGKKVLITLIVIVVVIIIVVLVRKSINKKVVNEVAQTDEQLVQESVESYSEGKVFPRGISELMAKYEGQNSKNDLYESLDNLVNEYLPTLFEDINGLSDSQLTNLFNEKKTEITENLGITQEDDFKKLATYLQNNNYGSNKFEYCEIDSNSYRTAGGNRYLSFIINLKYENQENQMQLRVYFANMTSTNPEIIYASAE